MISTLADEPRALRASEIFCRDVTRRQARNFYYGLKLLPEPKRSSMFALYAWMRCADDLADTGVGNSALSARAQAGDPHRRVEEFRLATRLAARENRIPDQDPWPGWAAFIACVRRHGVDPALFDAMIDGQKQDLDFIEPETFDQLRLYCHRVAGVVGLASIAIWGHTGGAQTQAMADDRGIAFQLTNILRDIREDARRGRIYLPRAELARFGLARQDIIQGRDSIRFGEFMRWQIQRAESFYRRSQELDIRITAESRPALAAMTAIYHGILLKIAAAPARVLHGRVGLGGLAKARIAWRAWRDGA